MSFLAGGGDLGARMRAFDWSSTSLGPAEEWPQSLKTCIRIILTSRQPMFVWWGEELINLYNDAYRPIVGGKHPAALAQPASVVWREIWDQVGPRAATAMRSNEGTYDEALLLIMERNGYPEETYYTFSYSPVPNDQGGTGGILCANTDDTQRIIGERQLALLRELATSAADARTLEEACARSASSLRTNLRDLPFAMIYLADRDRNSATLAGSSGIEAGDPAAPQTASLDGDAAWPLAAVLRAQKPMVIDNLALRFPALPTGAWDRPPREALAVPIVQSGQAGTAAVLIVGLNPFRLYDDSYRRFIELIAAQISANIGNAQAYEDERQRAEALAELDRAKTAFFSNVSHEFRTPLTLMLGPLEDMLAKPEAEVLPDNRELLGVMHRNGQRLLKLVNTLLDFARIEAGRVQAHYEPVDLAAYTADLASVFRAAIERAGMRLVVDTAPGGEPVYVDRDMWEKIVLNLVSNAFKYTLEGEIAVRLQQEGRSAVLTVRDTGTGIPADELPKLFNRFHRVQGARGRTHEGTGIGLALVQELARLHGGTVMVESTVGSGTTFTVRVPLGSAHLPQDRVTKGHDDTTPSGGAAKQYLAEALRWLPGSTFDEPADVAAGTSIDGAPRPKIVLADDNADMREYVRRLLLPFYDVTAVTDGVQALEAARTAEPDLVLTDVMMPNLDGFGLLEALRRNESTAGIPVIMLSARAGEEARVEGLEAGADDYLVKPFTARELLARVGGTLTLARVRREADKALEAERLGLREIFAHAPAFIATLRGPELRFEVANPVYLTMIGGRDVIGKPVREALPEIEEQGFIELLQQVYATAEPYVGQEVAVHLLRNGRLEERFVDFVYHPLRDPAGEVNGIFVHGHDVTGQVRARQQVERQTAELERAKEALEIADRRKDEFIATLSHELRTPLTAILGWARLLQLGGLDEATARAAIETIDHSARAQAQLIDDVLDISRITTGKVRIASEVVNVSAVALAALDTVRLAAHARGVRILTDVHVNDETLIRGDENRLQQVIWNLLSNAIKFTPEGGDVCLTVKGDGAVTIQVEDTGIGIAPDFLPHVFEAFRQAESTTTRVHGGLGLGLSIVRYLVELHGGQITAESAGLGRGTTFTVELPRLRPERGEAEPEPPVRRPAVPAASTAPDLKGTSVLVIDDQEIVRAYITAVLARTGAEVRTAASVEEAMAAVEQHLPDLVLCDLAMPHSDGFAFNDWLRNTHPGATIPVIAVTALGRPDDEARVRASGFAGYLRKPVDPEALTNAVVQALGR